MALDISYEKKLIELLGFTISNPDASNRFRIYNRDQEVGYIQYKKIYNKNVKKGIPTTYAYITKIDSDNIGFDYIRKVYDNGLKKLIDKELSYSFDVKRENNEKDHIDLTISDFIDISVWSKKYGYMNFSINYAGLYLYFKSQTDSFNISETVNYRVTDEPLSGYSYQISYSKKKKALSPYKKVVTKEISGYSLDDKRIRLFEKTYINDCLTNMHEGDVLGTVEEMVNMHQMGIDAFNHFRYLINQIIPFNQEIIGLLVSDEMIKKYHLAPFTSESVKTYKKEQS